MFLAMALICTTPDTITCNVITQSDNLYYSYQECSHEVQELVDLLGPQVHLVTGTCLKLGESA